MIAVGTNRSNKPFYNMAEFLCDYESDVADLPTNRGPGSTARVIESGNVYILNNSHQWIKQPKNSSGGGSSSEEEEIIVLNDAAPTDDIIIL